MFWGEDGSTDDSGRGAALLFTLYVPLAHSFDSLSAIASTSLATCKSNTDWLVVPYFNPISTRFKTYTPVICKLFLCYAINMHVTLFKRLEPGTG